MDDEPLILYGLSKTMMDLGEVKAVETGEKACEEIHSSFYDICFLDFFLHGKNGLEVMREIHEKSPGTKVVMMTAYADDETRKNLGKEAFLLLEKPFNLAHVKEIIRDAIA